MTSRYMVLPVNSGVLESAIQQEARSNAGFLYVRADDSVESIKEAYAESEDTGIPSRYTGSVSKANIRSQLDSMAEGSEVEMIRDGTVYFFNPFKLPGEESQELFNTLKAVFDEKRYFTRQDLVEYLRDADIYIAEDDVGDFISELRERDLLAKLEGQTAYYRPGKALRENTNLKGRSEIIEDGANSSGCITHADLEDVLEIDQITKEIKKDLTSDDVLYELNGKYLINSEDCKENFVQHFTENKLSRPIRESFKSSDWVKTETQFETNLRKQIKGSSNVLTAVNDEDLFYDMKEQVIEVLDLENEKTEVDGRHYSIFRVEDKLQQHVEQEAEAIETDVEKTINNNDPPSMSVALEQIDVPTYGSDSITDSYVREQILEQARMRIDNNDDINIWSTIEE